MKKTSLFIPLLSLAMTLGHPTLFSDPIKSVQTNLTPLLKTSDENSISSFTPPKGWRLADSASLPPTVKVMVVGKGQYPFPPSMNLSTEPYKGTLKQYLKTIKSMNDSQGYEWKDLGMMETQAGPASLSQVDTQTEWGNVRMMHVILLKNERIYILTSSALRDEFSKFYKDFFNAMKSLKLNTNFIEAVAPPLQGQLKLAYEKLISQWKERVAAKIKEYPSLSQDKIKSQTFKEEYFQKNEWIPYKEMIETKFADMGADWQTMALQNSQDDLFNINF